MESLLSFYKGIEIYKSVNNIKALGICYNNIGNILFDQKMYKESANSYRLSVKLGF